MTFEVIKTDIIKIVADAIVCPANKHLKEGGGASAGISQAAGRRKLTKACDSIAYCAVGSATATLAFDLKAEHLYNAAKFKLVDNFNKFSLEDNSSVQALCIPKKDVHNYSFYDAKSTRSLLEKTNCVLLVDVPSCYLVE